MCYGLHVHNMTRFELFYDLGCSKLAKMLQGILWRFIDVFIFLWTFSEATAPLAAVETHHSVCRLTENLQH